MTGVLIHFAVLFIIAGIGVAIVFRSRERRAEDVLSDLEAGLLDSQNGVKPSADLVNARKSRFALGDELGKMGLFTSQERHRFLLVQKLIPLCVCAGLVMLKLLFSPFDITGLLITAGMGLALGYLAARSRLKRRMTNYHRELEYFVPVVMERVVMAVQSGHDILAAISSLLELEQRKEDIESGRPDRTKYDPVTRLLEVVSQLTEAGLSFEKSLYDVAESVNCSVVKHAFIHLALAHKEGGELVVPLRELSDSTQLFYQEILEEEIAKLPVKATMPLLLTFAGLIVFFLTSPLIQIMKITSKAAIP